MSTIHLHRTTTSTPEQYIAGLTDFGPGRSKLFTQQRRYIPQSTSECPLAGRRHGRFGRHLGTPALRLVLTNRVVLKATNSNVWGGASGHTYTFQRRHDGTTDIDVVVVRDGKNLKGWALGFVLRTIGRRVFKQAFENSVQAIEARNDKAECLPTGNTGLAHEPSGSRPRVANVRLPGAGSAGLT